MMVISYCTVYVSHMFPNVFLPSYISRLFNHHYCIVFLLSDLSMRRTKGNMSL